ncbi:MAG: hypothetical protein ACLQU1_17115 [Bryobacteraceae bacterium]
MDLLDRLDLLHQEWCQSEFSVPFFDGIFVRAKNVHDLIAVDQNEFPFIGQEFWELLAVGLQFSL